MALLNNETQISSFVEGLDHPEGIACGADGYAYAGGEMGQIYKIDIGRREFSQVASTGGFIAGMALDSSHNIYACDVAKHCVQRITPSGVVTTYFSGLSNEPLKTPNYPAFDSFGNMYLTDSGDWKGDNGLIYKIRPGGQGEVWTRDVNTFPNGLCLGPKGDFLYVVMSLNTPRIVRIKIKDDGNPGPIETVIELPRTVPDGVAFDTESNLYISCYRPDRIYRLTPSGHLDILAEDWEGTIIASPTNIAFCGTERNILLSSSLGRWHITQYEVSNIGMPLHYPDMA